MPSQSDRAQPGKAVGDWIKRLQHGDPIERSRAVLELSKIGPEVDGVIPALISATSDDDFLVRKCSINVLGDYGEKALEAVPALVEIVDDHDPGIRISAAEALARIGPQYFLDKEDKLADALQDESVLVRIGVARTLWSNERDTALVLSVFMDALADPDPLGRAYAARGVVEMGAEGRKAIPLLRQLLEDRYEHVRWAAAMAIRCLEPQQPARVAAILAERDRRKRDEPISGDVLLGDWFLALGDNLENVRKRAVMALFSLDVAERWPTERWPTDLFRPAIPGLINALQEEDPEIRSFACMTLGALGETAQAAVPALAHALLDIYEAVRASAAGALAKIGLPRHSNFAFGKALQDESMKVRVEAARALWRRDGQAQVVLPILMAGLKDSDPYVRSSAAHALIDLGPAAKDAVPVLIKMLKDDIVRQAALFALHAIGKDARVAVPALLKLLTNGGITEQALATVALSKIGLGDKRGISRASAALRHQVAPVRCSAASLLGQTGPEAAVALPALSRATKDVDGIVRVESALAIWRIDRRGAEALPVLLAALTDQGDGVAASAASALAEIGPDARVALPALAELLGATDVSQRVAAAQALWAIDRQTAAVLPVLIGALKDAKATNRSQAVLGLGKMGLDAKSATPALREVLRDKDTVVRRHAAEALEKLREPNRSDQ